MEGHKLIVKSLRDTIADCECGMWSLTCAAFDRDTDEYLRANLDTQHQRHLDNVRRRRVRDGKAPSDS